MRIEYAGAIYHVMCRGDRREAIFRDDQDRERFVATLGQMCERTGNKVHGYVLMKNHYHLLLETPEPNLVAGMKWFQGTLHLTPLLSDLGDEGVAVLANETVGVELTSRQILRASRTRYPESAGLDSLALQLARSPETLSDARHFHHRWIARADQVGSFVRIFAS